MTAKFDFSLSRLQENLRAIAWDYQRLAGFDESTYRISAIGWGALLAAAVGALVFWRIRPGSSEPARVPLRAFLLAAGLWAAGYASVAFLRWRELRYDYLPTLGLSLLLAACCAAAFGASPRRWMPAGGALLAAYAAATVVADIQQCWRPQARNLQAIQAALSGLKDVRYHDIVAISGVPPSRGTAPHFAMALSYSSTPFVETVTGVWGLVVGRDFADDTGRLGLLHTDFFHELKSADLSRAHVVVCDERSQCRVRTLLAREVRAGQYDLYPLKNYAGPLPEPGRVYRREELAPWTADLYFSKKND
jgi:hypothetical protein